MTREELIQEVARLQQAYDRQQQLHQEARQRLEQEIAALRPNDDQVLQAVLGKHTPTTGEHVVLAEDLHKEIGEALKIYGKRDETGELWEKKVIRMLARAGITKRVVNGADHYIFRAPV